MTPMQIVEYGAAFMVVCVCVLVCVCSLAVTVGCVRANLSKQP